MRSGTLLDHARALLAHGYSIIPIPRPDATHNGKRAAIKWAEYCQRFATDTELVAWFGRAWEPQNIAIITGPLSNLVALDADSLAAEGWVREHTVPTPVQVVTHRGRQHYYQHGGGIVRNRVMEKGAIRLDVRGDGGYVIAPGSVHQSRDLYLPSREFWTPRSEVPVFDPRWLTDGGLVTAPPPPAPPRPRPSGDVVSRARAYARKVPCPPIGKRSDITTFQLACTLVRGFALDDDDALAVLIEWSAAHEFGVAWLREKIQSAHVSGEEPIGGRL